MRPSFNHWIIFVPLKHVGFHLRITFVLIVLVEDILHFYFSLFKSSSSQIGIFKWKWILIFMPILSVPGIMNIGTTVQFIYLYCDNILPVLNALQWKHRNWWWYVHVLWRQWTPNVECFAMRDTQWQAVSLLVTLMVVIWRVMLTPTYCFLELQLPG
jgi:hypothetical protein